MIEVRNLMKSYQSGDLITPVLKGISFRIQDGELCAIMGPLRLWQEHADEHPRLPRYADERGIPA